MDEGLGDQWTCLPASPRPQHQYTPRAIPGNLEIRTLSETVSPLASVRIQALAAPIYQTLNHKERLSSSVAATTGRTLAISYLDRREYSQLPETSNHF